MPLVKRGRKEIATKEKRRIKQVIAEEGGKGKGKEREGGGNCFFFQEGGRRKGARERVGGWGRKALGGLHPEAGLNPESQKRKSVPRPENFG